MNDLPEEGGGALLLLGGSMYHPGGLESFCQRAAAALNTNGGRWHADWYATDNAYLSLVRLPRAILRLAQSVKMARRYDVVWLQWSTLLDLLYLPLLRARGVPVIVTPHLGANARLQRIAILRETARWLLARADCLALLFAGQKEEIALPRSVPCTTIQSFLPAAALTDGGIGEREGPLRLIHVGRFSEAKGSFRAIALCAALQERGVACRATMIGRADRVTMASLQDAVDRAGVRQSIRFLDWLNEPGLIEAYEKADVLAHLSLSDSYPLAVLEAMARGVVPVVGPMLGAQSMVDRYGGYVAENSMVEAAADWLTRRSIEDLRDLGASISTAVRADFAWDACAERISAVADSIRRPRTHERCARGSGTA